VVRSEIAAARAAGARSLIPGDLDWPAALNDLTDCPPFLWARGDLTLLSRPLVALVGARAASSAGDRMARALAQDLSAAGFVIVSGLARGIDGAAHGGAMAGGTIAVLAGGVDVTYPPEHAGLMTDIAAKGLILSEQPMGLQPLARHFPLRNRIISGLSRGVVVVEAAAKSGSLITAQTALDQGREVMAVPGHPMDGRSAGCNLLIRDGAVLVRGAADVQAVLDAAPHSPRLWPVALGPGWAGQAIHAGESTGADVALSGARAAASGSVTTKTTGVSPATGAGNGGAAALAADGRKTGAGAATGPGMSGLSVAAGAADGRMAGAVAPAPAARGGIGGVLAGAPARPTGGGRDGMMPAEAQDLRHCPTTGTAGPPQAERPSGTRPARDGGTAVTGPSPAPTRQMDPRQTADLHRLILDRLSLVPVAEDQLIRDLATSATLVAPVLLDMEIDGAIRRQPGGLLVRAV
jgi:DNA protecting protein DprA